MGKSRVDVGGTTQIKARRRGRMWPVLQFKIIVISIMKTGFIQGVGKWVVSSSPCGHGHRLGWLVVLGAGTHASNPPAKVPLKASQCY